MNHYTPRDLAIAFYLLAIAAYIAGVTALMLKSEYPLTDPVMTYGGLLVAAVGIVGLGLYVYEHVNKPPQAWRERMLFGFFAGVLSFVFLALLVG